LGSLDWEEEKKPKKLREEEMLVSKYGPSKIPRAPGGAHRNDAALRAGNAVLGNRHFGYFD